MVVVPSAGATQRYQTVQQPPPGEGNERSPASMVAPVFVSETTPVVLLMIFAFAKLSFGGGAASADPAKTTPATTLRAKVPARRANPLMADPFLAGV
jgi:hypothetical protein